MTGTQRFLVLAVVVIGAFAITPDWLQRMGVFYLMLALIATIDINGSRKATNVH